MIRLNLFLPFFRKRKKSEPPGRPISGPLAAWLSDPETGRKGRIRKRLALIGDTWLSSPLAARRASRFFLGFITLFVWVAWPYGGANYAQHREWKEKIAAEFFLIIDPLVSLSTSIASRQWVWSLSAAGIILAVCLLVPRGFCGVRLSTGHGD